MMKKMNITKILFWVTEDKYKEFHKLRNFYVGSNYKLLKEINLQK